MSSLLHETYIHINQTLPPVIVAMITVAMWTWTDIEVKKMQVCTSREINDSEASLSSIALCRPCSREFSASPQLVAGLHSNKVRVLLWFPAWVLNFLCQVISLCGLWQPLIGTTSSPSPRSWSSYLSPFNHCQPHSSPSGIRISPSLVSFCSKPLRIHCQLPVQAVTLNTLAAIGLNQNPQFQDLTGEVPRSAPLIISSQVSGTL
jgi:hypothetical protein